MNQKKILIPTTNAESWKDLLAKPDNQWKNGYSAKSVAESWENRECKKDCVNSHIYNKGERIKIWQKNLKTNLINYWMI